MAHLLVLISQVTPAKFVTQCVNVPADIALGVVFNSPVYRSVFLESGV